MSEVVIRIPAEVLRELLQRAEPSPAGRGSEARSPYEAPRMTDPQRRMIYRLGFQLGNDADAVRDLIRHRLGADPTREEASNLIDSLQSQVRARSNGGNHAS